MAGRGPGSGLRQARTAAEAVQWHRLLEALGAPHSDAVLPHLGLRSADAETLRAVCTGAAASLTTIMSETSEPAMLGAANAALQRAYAELEQAGGARLARAVFALGDDGFPGSGERELMLCWDAALRSLREGGLEEAALPAAQRDIVVALLGHHFATVEPLDTLAAQVSREGRLGWLVELARWRRFASVCRALAKVLTPLERQRVALAAAQAQPRPVRSVQVDCWPGVAARAGGAR